MKKRITRKSTKTSSHFSKSATKPSKNIKGIVFDLDNTLYSYVPAHLAGLNSAHKIYPVKYSKATFVKRYDIARMKNEVALFGVGASHNRILYFQRMLEADNCFTPQRALDLSNAYWIAFMDKMKVEPDTKKALLHLVRSYKMGILTDLTADIQFSKLSAHRLWPFFDAIVTSEEAGVEKSNTKGLRLLLAKMKLSPREVVFVGDNPINDGIAARSLGIPYIRVLRSDMNGVRGGAVAHKRIKRISELHEILDHLQAHGCKSMCCRL